MTKTIRARYVRGIIEPLEEFEMEEGRELNVTIEEVPGEVRAEDALDSTFGGWKGLIDAEELKRNIYQDRLLSTRRRARL